MIIITRYHDICMGHRVYGHENKCARLHGHNYRFRFSLLAPNGLDKLGRVIDFSIIKSKLCNWLEENWDHKMILFQDDPIHENFAYCFGSDEIGNIVPVPFNPTAENIAIHMVKIVGPLLLSGTSTVLYSCMVEETRKCSATYTLEPGSDEYNQIIDGCELKIHPAPLTPEDYEDLPF